ncbi:MAG: GDSL-type esterase/lipase family protein [Candidatus Saccharibacteria bacterium]|nr:GDSL-type esterase/lipase family protein [Candidatus Saccharibacteria bacterium]
MRIFIFGDSIAQGFYDSHGGWAERIAAKYHRHAVKNRLAGMEGSAIMVYGLGASGDTADGVLNRIKPEVEARQLWEDDDFIIIAIGINDAILRKNTPAMDAYEFQGKLEKILSEAQKLSDNIMFVGLTAVDESKTDPWAYSTTGNQWKNSRINLFEDTIKQVAEYAEVPFIPIHDAFLAGLEQGHELLTDGLHPNDAGHKFIAAKVEPSIAQLINQYEAKL